MISLRELPSPVALVLGGGGSLGALQVGMLQVLNTAGVKPDVVVGTSVGALNGAVIAERGLTGAVPHLEQVWRSTRRHAVFPVRFAALRRIVGRNPVFDGSGIERLVRTHLSATTFEALDHPLVVVATDAATGESQSFAHGDLVRAITASAAIPGVFAAVEIDGRPYLDGGVSQNLPVAAAHAWGAASIIALDVASRPAVGAPIDERSLQLPDAPTSIIDSALFAAGVLFRQQRVDALQAAAAEMPVVVVETPPTGVQPLNFSQASDLISDGRRLAQTVVDSLSITGPGLYGLMPGLVSRSPTAPLEQGAPPVSPGFRAD